MQMLKSASRNNIHVRWCACARKKFGIKILDEIWKFGGVKNPFQLPWNMNLKCAARRLLLETWSCGKTKVRCAEKTSSPEITHDLPGGERHSKANGEKPQNLHFCWSSFGSEKGSTNSSVNGRSIAHT